MAKGKTKHAKPRASTKTRSKRHKAHRSNEGGPAGHRHQAHGSVGAIGFAVITVSSTRTPDTDESGNALREMFRTAGHATHFYRLVADDVEEIQHAVRDALTLDGVDVVVTNGGTGMSRSDVTLEAVGPIIEKRAEGWGDVFRSISRDEVGTSAFLSRSVAGTVGQKWIVCIPGSPGAVRTAAKRLLLPEVEHMVWELRR